MGLTAEHTASVSNQTRLTISSDADFDLVIDFMKAHPEAFFVFSTATQYTLPHQNSWIYEKKHAVIIKGGMPLDRRQLLYRFAEELETRAIPNTNLHFITRQDGPEPRLSTANVQKSIDDLTGSKISHPPFGTPGQTTVVSI